MRMSEGVEWAAHCATLLAALPDGLALSSGVLAEFHGVPQPYLAKSLQALSRAGIVGSTPGRTGGYWLARPAAEVTLLDVVLAVEGDERAYRCTEIRRNAPYRSPATCYRTACGIAAAMWRAEDAWRAELRAVTVADLARHVGDVVPPDILARNADWVTRRVGRA